jgi:glycosidase
MRPTLLRLLPLTGLLSCGTDPKPRGGDDSGPAAAGACLTRFTYTPTGDELPDSVAVAGAFNNWDPEAAPMVEGPPGTWTVELPLEPGAHPYKLVERTDWSMGEGYEAWVCDPLAEQIHCEAGYKEPWDTGWTHSCGSGTTSSCNSLVVVADCALPSLTLTTLSVDRAAGAISITLTGAPGAGGAALRAPELTVDGAPAPLAWDGATGTATVTGLPTGETAGRHTLRVSLQDEAGAAAEPLFIPVWMDGAGEDPYRAGSIYFAFIDRLANGDVSLDASEGATAPIADYAGGDLQGVIDLLDYLDELGVRTVWLSNPQGNAEGAWDGDCGAVYAGYHQYWPNAARDVEEHLGGPDELHALVDGAHARGMRVIMDWVANHVHDDHPYAQNEGWFNGEAICKDSSGGQSNWDRIPESCWFAPYLPDIDYAQPDALHTMVDDALWWAKTYDLDGLRVDAVKHMPHAVPWNLEARIRREIEHAPAGGDTAFWTVGETFDGVDRIRAYISSDGRPQLDGQFDFPLYYAVNDAFGSMALDFYGLEAAVATSEAAWGGKLMSSFLGNHDVMRFTTLAVEGWRSSCQDGVGLVNAGLPWDPGVYARMRLAWTFLFAQPAVPLVYYGDEIGLPGYTDPDNRQPLWWRTGDLSGGIGSGVEAVAARVSSEEAATLRHVAKLGQARRDHPSLWRGAAAQWWIEGQVWAWARVDPEGSGMSLVLLNRSGESRSLENGLAFAGLRDGTYEDLLTGQTFTGSGDRLRVDVPAMGSRVLVLR